jgi:hypothetical protein
MRFESNRLKLILFPIPSHPPLGLPPEVGEMPPPNMGFTMARRAHLSISSFSLLYRDLTPDKALIIKKLQITTCPQLITNNS